MKGRLKKPNRRRNSTKSPKKNHKNLKSQLLPKKLKRLKMMMCL